MKNNFGPIVSLFILVLPILINLSLPVLEQPLSGSLDFTVEETSKIGLFTIVQGSRNLDWPGIASWLAGDYEKSSLFFRKQLFSITDA
ncbi:MAG TPA: hypothetical protein QGG35_07050 [Candidatus Marinimicrobia bacterium]|jgi:hypothetical protein|nr:hypothetical protein [Candidatus Neomarinimicrobiota bacterium]MDP7528434.1 hypothetical protein [Candidatus Neomarinimicrobiota bacterium]HJL85142.1 hypothetical protein [Candidatus Neomarinimicrobiota bacterium]|tara:strand:- start:18 stop:281 length:264 start_codon:yes stop_codon:yes gene_type:complete